MTKIVYRSERIPPLAVDEIKNLKSGGYVNTYEAVCDYLNTPVLSDICWDISNLYVLHEIKDFNLSNLSLRVGIYKKLFFKLIILLAKPTVMDYKGLLKALSYNTYFTSLTLESKVEKEVIQYVAEVFQVFIYAFIFPKLIF